MNTVIELYRNKNNIVADALDKIVVDAFMQKEKEQHTSFMICGCDAGAGTTTMSIELAIAMAAAGWKTILVDADLRKESRYKRLNEITKKGISDYIAGNGSLEEIIYPTNWSELNYISCGKDESETPVKMLCSSHMSTLIESLREKYDIIIFDAPSLNTVVDAQVLGTKVDCVYLVASSGQSTFANLTSAKDQLQGVGANVAGVILNRAEMDEYRRYVKQFDYFENKEYLSGYNKHVGKESKDPKKKSLVSFLKNLMGCLVLSTVLMTMSTGNTAVSASEDVSTDTSAQENDLSSTDASGETEDAGAWSDSSRKLPIVFATGYTIEEEKLSAGESATVHVTIENKSRDVAAHEMSVTLYLDTTGISLSQGETNQRYVELLNPGETMELEFQIDVSEDIESDVAQLEFRFDYLNAAGDTGTNSTTISPNIEKDCELKIISVTSSKNATVGSEALLNVRYENSGALDIESVSMRVEGNVASAGQEISLDPLEKGKQNSVDEAIVYTETGNQTVKVSITYTDADGNSYESDPYEVSCMVFSNETQEETGTVVETTDGGTGMKKYLAAAAGVAALLIVVVAAVLIRGKKHIKETEQKNDTENRRQESEENNNVKDAVQNNDTANVTEPKNAIEQEPEQKDNTGNTAEQTDNTENKTEE